MTSQYLLKILASGDLEKLDKTLRAHKQRCKEDLIIPMDYSYSMFNNGIYAKEPLIHALNSSVFSCGSLEQLKIFEKNKISNDISSLKTAYYRGHVEIVNYLVRKHLFMYNDYDLRESLVVLNYHSQYDDLTDFLLENQIIPPTNIIVGRIGLWNDGTHPYIKKQNVCLHNSLLSCTPLPLELIALTCTFVDFRSELHPIVYKANELCKLGLNIHKNPSEQRQSPRLQQQEEIDKLSKRVQQAVKLGLLQPN